VADNYEIWIREKRPPGMWMLFDIVKSRLKAEAIVRARIGSDSQRDYEIRESSIDSTDTPWPHQDLSSSILPEE